MGAGQGRIGTGGVRFVFQPGSAIPEKNRGEGAHTATGGGLQGAAHAFSFLYVYAVQRFRLSGGIIPVYGRMGLIYIVLTTISNSNAKKKKKRMPGFPCNN